MGTLTKKVTADSSYLWLKTLKSIICFSGFPKKACQGCHISEGTGTILIKIIFLKSWYFCDSSHTIAVSGNSMSHCGEGCAQLTSTRVANIMFDCVYPSISRPAPNGFQSPATRSGRPASWVWRCWGKACSSRRRIGRRRWRRAVTF